MAFNRRPQQSHNTRLGNRLLQGVVDAGMLLALADGDLEDEEITALVQLVSELGPELSENQITSALQASAREMESGWEARVEKLQRTVTSDDDRQTVLSTTAMIMLADGELEEGDEYELYVLLADAFGYDQDSANSILEQVAQQFGDSSDDEEEESEDEEEYEEEEEEAPAPRGASRGASNAASKSTSQLKPTTLRRGDRGPEIRNLQVALNNQGYGLNVDGVFGPATERAVRDFQANNGLATDGMVGARTRSALGMSSRMAAVTHAGETNAPPPQPAPNPPARRSGTSIGKGARGGRVETIQSALANMGYNVNIDGIFGPGTERAVMAFQASNGLSVDGIVGPRTWALLAPYAGAG